jgi:hypothetical protein
VCPFDIFNEKEPMDCFLNPALWAKGPADSLQAIAHQA